MKLEEISQFLRVEYEMVCDICQTKQTILTQAHVVPEYETEIYLLCQCGNYIEFELPVN